MSQRFGRDVRLRARREFQAVQQHGRRVSSRFVIVLGQTSERPVDRLGIIASRRFGGAVDRARAKRRIREIFRRQEPDRHDDRVRMDLVVIPKRALLDAPFADVARDVGAAIERLRRSRASAP